VEWTIEFLEEHLSNSWVLLCSYLLINPLVASSAFHWDCIHASSYIANNFTCNKEDSSESRKEQKQLEQMWRLLYTKILYSIP